MFRSDRFLSGAPLGSGLPPDVLWCNTAGTAMTPADWEAPDGATLVMILAGDEPSLNRAGLILHRGSEAADIVLPPPRPSHVWRLLADSAEPESDQRDLTLSSLTVQARSVVVLAEYPVKAKGPIPPSGDLIGKLSRAAGIAPAWWDVAGHHTVVTDDTKRVLLAAMNLAVGSEGEARDSLRQFSQERERRAVPLAIVSRGEMPVQLAMAIEPGLSRRPVWLNIEREDGEVTRLRLGAEDGDLTSFTGLDGMPAQSWKVPLPELPEGRHRLWRDGEPDVVCHLTIAPRRCFLPESIRRGEKLFGVSAQLYALRRAGDQGVGDFTTLAELAQAAGQVGAATVGINPLHMLFPGQRERASPYHPSDRRFLDPIYLDLGEAQEDGGAFVDWPGVWRHKQAALERRFAALPASELQDFDAFIAAGGTTLRRFAIFQAIAETHPQAWDQWPAALRAPDNPAVAAFARAHEARVRFHQYAQFLADRQLGEAAAVARRAGLELGLYRDLAVGAAPDGAESWARAGELARGAWVGAPPDPLAPHGQNWHLPPPIPARMADGGYASFARLLAANMRHAGALRIDHVLGLTRLFWIPEGGSGEDGAYVTYPLNDLLGQVTLESARARCLVVGEDLGTVPDGLRPVLSDADMLSYRVLLLEREGLGFLPPSSYPERAVACVTTHDLPPLAGWLDGADLREKADLGLLPAASDAAVERAVERAALTDTLRTANCLESDNNPSVEAVVAGAYGFVAATPADLMLVQSDDLAGAREGVNLPGTDTERPNWRRRLREPVETLLTNDTARAILKQVRDRGRGRTP